MTPQVVYDMNIMAIKFAEDPKFAYQLLFPYDGFFTSHQKRRVQVIKDHTRSSTVCWRSPTDFPHALDRDNPISVGAYMNEPDTLNNRYQQSEAMYNAEKVFEEFAKEYAELSGREYPDS